MIKDLKRISKEINKLKEFNIYSICSEEKYIMPTCIACKGKKQVIVEGNIYECKVCEGKGINAKYVHKKWKIKTEDWKTTCEILNSKEVKLVNNLNEPYLMKNGNPSTYHDREKAKTPLKDCFDTMEEAQAECDKRNEELAQKEQEKIEKEIEEEDNENEE